ncbi:MAG TPA: two-component regulator propeller domain-containing protein, partial [Chthoniobacteraceae bacterium]|nr:two-component regulator propeller domain-containing protein [Chthoniobacteraceae bacterium]
MGRAFIIGLIAACSALALPLRAADSGSTLAPTTDWLVRSWQTEEGLPQNTVNAIFQTRDGFLWVGTSGGLARFDGVRFRTFGLQDGLRSVRVSTLVEDARGALWIGAGGGVSRWKSGRLTTFDNAEGFPSGADVVSMATDRDDSIWIGTTEGLVKWRNGSFALIGDAQGLPRKQIRALVQDSQGTLWVSVLSDGVYRGTNGQFARVEGAGPVSGDCYSLMEDRDGSIWVGAGNGVLWRWREGTWQRFDQAHGLPMASFTALAQHGDGTLLICAGDRGLLRNTSAGFAPATNEGELSGQNVRAAMVDRDGSVWVGTSSDGLHRLSRRMLQYWSAIASLGTTTVTSIAEDASGVRWIGAASKGLYRFEGGRFSLLEDPAVSATTHHIYCTTMAGDGSIWAAGEGCLYRFQPGQLTKAFLETPIRGEAVRALCADGDALWLGTYYSTLLKCDGGGVQVMAPRGSFRGDITSIEREATDTLWIGSAGGLHRWERGKIVRTLDTRDGLLTGSIQALLHDPDGTLWIGTLGGGLARLKDGRIFNFTTRHGLIDDVIKQLVADDHGYLWMGCNHGIMRVARRELHALADGKISEVHPAAFGKNEGMLKEQCVGGHSPTAIKTRDGHLVFPTAGGIVEIDPQRLDDVMTAAPQAGIDSIFVDGQPRTLYSELVLPPGTHRIEVNYAAPALRGGDWVRFRHKLEGLEHDWVLAGGQRPATYDGLLPHRYVFRVMASDGRGKWNEPGAQLAITVQPQFWQTLWFRAVAAGLVIGLNGGAVLWYTRRKHARQIAELERARQQEAELARVSRVSLLGELSASLAHELNQPLAAILTNAQAALRFLTHDPAELNEVRSILKDITAADRRASEIIGRMRAMMKKGEVQMESRDLNADIEQVLALLH